MHPLSFPSSGNDSGTAQVGEMTRDFGLIDIQGFYQKANADLVSADKINYS
jgi:hypothetical protein